MEDNVVLKGVAWVGITASCLRLSFRKQDVDGGEQDGLHCRDNQLREQEEAARKHQSHENDSCENSSGRDGYVDEVDGLGGLNGLGIGIDSLIHDANARTMIGVQILSHLFQVYCPVTHDSSPF